MDPLYAEYSLSTHRRILMTMIIRGIETSVLISNYSCWDLDCKWFLAAVCNIIICASCQIYSCWYIPEVHATFAPKQAWHLLTPGARGGGCKVLILDVILDEGTIMFDSLLWWQERLPWASNASKLSLKLAVSTTQTSTMIDGWYLISS